MSVRGVPGGLAANLVGSTTNDNAAAGIVGEFIQSILGSGSAVNLTSGAAANVTSISLTPGDWDVFGNVAFTPAATTSITNLAASIGTVSATIGSFTTAAVELPMAAFVPGVIGFTQTPPQQRISLAVTTTIFLVAAASFTVSTLAAYGSISARRRR